MRAMEREEGGQQRSRGRMASAVENAVVEHGGDSRVGSRMGAGVAAIREESEEWSFFY
jgi:hypothetical protein